MNGERCAYFTTGVTKDAVKNDIKNNSFLDSISPTQAKSVVLNVEEFDDWFKITGSYHIDVICECIGPL